MDTLVLSAVWEPMYRVHWPRAITLWVAGRVERIEDYADRAIPTVRYSVPMPLVVRFVRNGKVYRRGIRFNRENVFARDRGLCQYCGERVGRRNATYDHVLPRSHGGGTDWYNIVLACVSCNQFKGDRTPEEAGMRLLKVPQEPRSLPTSREILFYEEGMPLAWQRYLRSPRS